MPLSGSIISGSSSHLSSGTERDVRGAMRRFWERGCIERELNDRDDQKQRLLDSMDEDARGQHMNDISKTWGALRGDPVEPSLEGNDRAPSATSTRATWR